MTIRVELFVLIMAMKSERHVEQENFLLSTCLQSWVNFYLAWPTQTSSRVTCLTRLFSFLPIIRFRLFYMKELDTVYNPVCLPVLLHCCQSFSLFSYSFQHFSSIISVSLIFLFFLFIKLCLPHAVCTTVVMGWLVFRWGIPVVNILIWNMT